MLWFVKNWRVLAVIGAFLAGLGLYALGRHDGKQQAAVAAAEATARAVQKRVDVDEKIIGLDSYQLCIELGGGVQCNDIKLRGMEVDSR
ncbi:hypothetical protein FHS76_003529 [Ochrobactrum daejeonense]|uniref:Uncharacterized protein n=1 Tax=Brucella daejeonensis TaxID=659015 RepID=A0A7W9AZS8_9HYPH|nr:hypothetical protein [Brucella daejeonensis]MBB5703622.1 hypothetical protein [Brucella daejeonensis]